MGYHTDIISGEWYELERRFDEVAEADIKQQRKERRGR